MGFEQEITVKRVWGELRKRFCSSLLKTKKALQIGSLSNISYIGHGCNYFYPSNMRGFCGFDIGSNIPSFWDTVW